MPGANWLAAISYSLYLSHKIAFHLVEGAIAPTTQKSGLLLFGIYAVATLIFGAVLHYLVEQPFLNWRDRRLSATLANANLVQ